MTKFLTAYINSLLTTLAITIGRIAVPGTESVDKRVEAFAATLEAEATAEDVKADALREVAVASSIKSLNASRAANYRRGTAAAIREAAVY